jgi:hypothetical protein
MSASVGSSPTQHPSADLPGVIGPGSGQRHPALVLVAPSRSDGPQRGHPEGIGGCRRMLAYSLGWL